MEKVKTIVDREPVSSDYIGKKQNFGHVLSQVKNLKPPIWKSMWFYGPVGVAVIAITLSVTAIDPMSGLKDATQPTAQSIKTLVNETTSTPNSIHSQKIAAHSEKNVYAANNVVNSPKISNSNEMEMENEVIIEEEIEDEPEFRKNKVLEEPIIIRKNFLPHIQGNYNGNIPFGTLCSAKGIECNDEVQVIAFEIQYFTGSTDKSTKVVGNKIPDDICESIAAHNIGNMIFITDIKGVNHDGNIIHLTSLNYTPTN